MTDEPGRMLRRLLTCRLREHEIGDFFAMWARLSALIDQGIHLDDRSIDSLRVAYATIALRFQAAARECEKELKERNQDERSSTCECGVCKHNGLECPRSATRTVDGKHFCDHCGPGSFERNAARPVVEDLQRQLDEARRGWALERAAVVEEFETYPDASFLDLCRMESRDLWGEEEAKRLFYDGAEKIFELSHGWNVEDDYATIAKHLTWPELQLPPSYDRRIIASFGDPDAT